MNEKPEALRLADVLDAAAHPFRGCLEALSATELRRQHAENERLNAIALQAQNAAIDLTKKNERLREALEALLSLHDDPCTYDAATTRAAARAALRREPGDG